MAKLLTVQSNLAPGLLEEVCLCTSQDGVLAMATESFYALGASVHSPAAIKRVTAIKGRPSNKPLLVLIGDRNELDLLVQSIPSWALSLLDQFWPGPLTCIFQCRSHLPELLTMGSGTIGVRCPGNSQLRSILNATGPLTGTSANRSGLPPISTAAKVSEEFGKEIDLILDSGLSPGGLPSTILDLAKSPRIFRRGAISTEDIQAVLGKQGIRMADNAVG